MFLEFFNDDLNGQNTRYEMKLIILGILINTHQFYFPIDESCAGKQKSKRICVSLIVLGPEFNCSLCANFISGYKLNIAHRIFPVLPLLVSELLTFNVNRSLNDDSNEAGEILGVLL